MKLKFGRFGQKSFSDRTKKLKIRKRVKKADNKLQQNESSVQSPKTKSHWLYSIRTRLIAAVAIMVLPIFFLGLFSYNSAYQSIRQTAQDSMTEVVNQTSKYIQLAMQNVSQDCSQIFKDANFNSYVASPTDDASLRYEVDTLMKSISRENSFIDDIILLIDGKMPLSASSRKIDQNALKNIGNGQLMTLAKQKDVVPFWRGSVYELENQVEGLDYAMALVRLVKDPSTKEAKGLLVFTVKRNLVSDSMNNVTLGENSELHLISPDRKDIALRVVDNASQIIDTSEAVAQVINTSFYNEMVSREDSTGSGTAYYRGEEHLALYSKVGTTGYVLIGLAPVSNFYSMASSIRNATFMITAVVIVFAILVGFFMVVSVGRAMNGIVELTNKAAEGDLTVSYNRRRRDEFGILAGSFSRMLNHMRGMISNVSESASNVSESAKTIADTSKEAAVVAREIAKAVEEIATGAADQANEAEQCNKKMSDLGDKINAVSEYAREIGEFTSETAQLTKLGLSTVENLEKASKESTEITQGIISDIQTLDENSKSIGNIIEVIDQIADQTNLLALNAAIEAARAGDAGRGFAVVADEIRKLAEQSVNATAEIAKIIENNRNQTAVVAKRALSANDIIESQNKAVTDTTETFNRISAAMEQLAKKVENILDIIADMDTYKSDTLLAIQNISSVSQQIAASTEEVTASSEEQLASIEQLSKYAEQLEKIAMTLNNSISRFKVQ